MPSLRSDDDEFAAGFWLIAILLGVGIFIVAGKLIQALGTAYKPHRGHPAMVWALVPWILGLSLSFLVGIQDPGAGVVTGFVVTGIWAVAVVSISAILRNRVEAARQDDLLPHYVDDEQWWED